MKNFFAIIAEGIGALVLFATLSLTYIIVGVVLSAPYVYLSGWDENAFVNFSFILPILVGIIVVITFFAMMTYRLDKDKVTLIVLGCIYLWLFLPVWINLLVYSMHFIGFDNAALNLLYELRFVSLALSVIAIILFLFAWGFVEDKIRNWQKKHKQPAN
jgi:hypothetical protein